MRDVTPAAPEPEPRAPSKLSMLAAHNAPPRPQPETQRPAAGVSPMSSPDVFRQADEHGQERAEEVDERRSDPEGGRNSAGTREAPAGPRAQP